MADDRPIGVFDSGVGGLTVVEALRRRVPHESILYLGDTARLPYGTKSAETVARYSARNIDFLLARGVKAVVVACNTASALALENVTERAPVWGVIGPGARAAVRAARSGAIGVLATESTVLSDAYGRAIRRIEPRAEILNQPCPLFVPLVEEGWHDDEIAEAVARRYVEPLLEKGASTLILGCTHYPRLVPLLEGLVGRGVALVDPAETVAVEVAQRLEERGLLRTAGAAPRHHLCVTDLAERFRRIAADLLQQPEGWGEREGEITLEWVEVA
ncbi:MAG: glutamate racemase [Acidobacteriota bacterium]